MAKLIVRDPNTGQSRPMTQKSYDVAGKKRGFTIVGKVDEPKSEMEVLKDKLRAEKAAKESHDQVETDVIESEPEQEKPVKRQYNRKAKPE